MYNSTSRKKRLQAVKARYMMDEANKPFVSVYSQPSLSYIFKPKKHTGDFASFGNSRGGMR